MPLVEAKKVRLGNKTGSYFGEKMVFRKPKVSVIIYMLKFKKVDIIKFRTVGSATGNRS